MTSSFRSRPAVFALLCALIATLVLAAASARADEATDKYLAQLRGSDPAAAEKFTALYTAKDSNLKKVKQIQQQLHETTDAQKKDELYRQFKAANKTYLSSYLDYLAFLDELDLKGIHQHEQAIEKIKATMEKRARGREEIKQAYEENSK